MKTNSDFDKYVGALNEITNSENRAELEGFYTLYFAILQFYKGIDKPIQTLLNKLNISEKNVELIEKQINNALPALNKLKYEVSVFDSNRLSVKHKNKINQLITYIKEEMVISELDAISNQFFNLLKENEIAFVSEQEEKKFKEKEAADRRAKAEKERKEKEIAASRAKAERERKERDKEAQQKAEQQRNKEKIKVEIKKIRKKRKGWAWGMPFYMWTVIFFFIGIVKIIKLGKAKKTLEKKLLEIDK